MKARERWIEPDTNRAYEEKVDGLDATAFLAREVLPDTVTITRKEFRAACKASYENNQLNEDYVEHKLFASTEKSPGGES